MLTTMPVQIIYMRAPCQNIHGVPHLDQPCLLGLQALYVAWHYSAFRTVDTPGVGCLGLS